MSLRMTGVQKLDDYHRTDFRYLPVHTGSIDKIALRDFASIKLTFVRFMNTGFMSTGCFLILYCKGRTK